jgi:enamine deaminase RidA (YjgF/YER057c/UK114 family)
MAGWLIMDDASVLDRLSRLGLELPPPPEAVASYVPVVVAGPFAFVSGQVPLVAGSMLHAGHVGADVSLEQAQEAAQRCAVLALSALRGELGSFERVRRIAKVTVFVASSPGFTDQPKVANGASDVLADVLGDAGRHAREAVGVTELPLGASVEVSLTVELEP